MTGAFVVMVDISEPEKQCKEEETCQTNHEINQWEKKIVVLLHVLFDVTTILFNPFHTDDDDDHLHSN